MEGANAKSLPSLCKTTVEWLHQTQEMLDLSMSEAASVKVFLSRWITIRRNLEQLSAQFFKLEEVSGSFNSALCNELLQNISKTLGEMRDLAERCIEESFGGKLQMQSSLDGLALKLSLHVRECELLLRSGVVKDSSLLRSSSGGATKDNVKWSIRDLLARMQIGNVESKLRAMESLLQLLNEDDKNVLIVASQESGTSILVQLLNAGVGALRDRAADAVCLLSQIDSCEHFLVSEGALEALVHVLESGTSSSKERAASALKNLTCTSENAISVLAHGGACVLLELCQTGTPAAQASAVGTIRNLASIPEVQNSIVEEGAVPVLVGLVNSGTPLSQEYACDALQSLAAAGEIIRQTIIREGAISALMLFYDSTPSPKGKEISMGALGNLAASETNIDELLSIGFLSRLVSALRNGLLTEQQSAALAVCHLARSTELCKLLGSIGCIPPLVRLLEGKSSTSQDMAAKAIFNLLSADANRRIFCKEEKSIAKLVNLLDLSLTASKKYPILTLLCLAGRKRCRKQMVAAGACQHLVKLLDSEGNASRKLLERLEGAKVWGIFRV
ncbi:hypothetical protein KP509_35G003100 [Ceratopteris richardii]|nr:hypothetical protein KP509_35G003100 [Ceratopteris richardii]